MMSLQPLRLILHTLALTGCAGLFKKADLGKAPSAAPNAGAAPNASSPSVLPPLPPFVLPPLPPGESALDRAQALTQNGGFAWVHFPKDGSSFLNLISASPTLCPLLPKNAWLAAEDDVSAVNPPSSAIGPVPLWIQMWNPDYNCAGQWSKSFDQFASRNHFSIGATFEMNSGRILGMFRQPEQRLISAFHYHLDHTGWNMPVTESLTEYARTRQGCHTKMLTRRHLPECFLSPALSPPPTPEETALAVERVRGFAFVGILEEWDLSVCLWHAKFGGYCYERELGNSRLGSERDSSDDLYDTAPLEGFEDVADRPVYEEALRIFHMDLERFGITHENCPYFCSPPAGH